MLHFTNGNLLDAEVEALVNTVNTVGVMGKGIALMFKEAFPENYKQYKDACKVNAVSTGEMFVTERLDLMASPRWIINFPTKEHWRSPSQMSWIVDGLQDLKRVIAKNGIRSIAIPPLGSGNGGLNWADVRAEIVQALGELHGVEIIIYEPTRQYQNVAKKTGVQKLTPARALMAELVRRYAVLGIQCTLLEVQKLAYVLERQIESRGTHNPLDLRFEANKFGPYADRLSHLMNALDGSYIQCDKRIADASPFDIVRFNEDKADRVSVFLKSDEAKPYADALRATVDLIDGFESPLGMELLATIDWLINKEGVMPERDAVRGALKSWPGGVEAGSRKNELFEDIMIDVALKRLQAA
ncbi:macro domain-containing protein [Hyphomonas sp.]|jgi:O-acetyl-ADP-ribose deacetylase (regulator of RNase III)|uniref:type II toxin-antitoxin system antitoxin DNA ADP-ribosyl glycohydrolase DarG n=1 Tax=Hyphomonas sp. TaxID=87 RepID=UPI0032D932CB